MLTASTEMRKKLRSITKSLSRHEMQQWQKVLTGVDRGASVLEVGCGRGGKTDFLRSQGFGNILGVEKNEFQVEQCCKRGLNVISVDEFDHNYDGELFDFIILSHIIEHFEFNSLCGFIDGYLKYLRPGGLVLIATPILHPYFWHDLDHQKPYYPQGIKNFYGIQDEQVGFTSKYHLKLKDIRYRKSPFRVKNSRSLLLKKGDLPLLLFNMISAGLFKLSHGLVGYNTGWVGLYKLCLTKEVI